MLAAAQARARVVNRLVRQPAPSAAPAARPSRTAKIATAPGQLCRPTAVACPALESAGESRASLRAAVASEAARTIWMAAPRPRSPPAITAAVVAPQATAARTTQTLRGWVNMGLHALKAGRPLAGPL